MTDRRNYGRIERGERYFRRNTRLLGLGCGILGAGLVICMVSLLLLIPLLPRIGMQLAGLEPVGETVSIFGAATPIPTIQVQNASAPAQVVVDAGPYGTFNLDTRSYAVAVGQSGAGTPLATASFTESQLVDLCRQRSVLCGAGDNRVRNASFDLRPGGAIINADFYIPQVSLWQRAGIVLKLNSTSVQFDVAGVDLNGTLYSVPPGNIADSVNRIATTGNDLLRSLTVNTAGESLHLSEIYADDNTLTLILR